MRMLTVTLAGGLLPLVAVLAAAQTGPDRAASGPQPLYRVTIVSRTTKALNYGYLTVPTRIGFRGTPLLGNARGHATVQVKRGSTTIEAKFSNVPPPAQFGPQYLTYVVWAISADGRPQNLGELSLSASDKGSLTASTSLQTFAMIVTAEPYYSVSQPSDVVVMENVVIPETIGKVEELNATYELLPRKDFTYDIGRQVPAGGKPVSRREYDAILAIYQAQNAIQIAESQSAQRYAPDRLAQARQVLEQARQYPKNQSAEIVATAREAAQIAEDSRVIAGKRADEERSAAEHAKAQEERKQIEVSRNVAEAERAEADRAETELAAARRASQERTLPEPPAQTQLAPAPPAATAGPPVEVDERQSRRQDSQALENRARLFSTLRSSFGAIDSPRGIVVTIPNAAVSSPLLEARLQLIALAIRPYKDLRLEVEGHSASPDVSSTQQRAELVRTKLIAASVPPDIIIVRGYGNSRPRASNASAGGRAQNERVEIVIAGDGIGSLATWDHLYAIMPSGTHRQP